MHLKAKAWAQGESSNHLPCFWVGVTTHRYTHTTKSYDNAQVITEARGYTPNSADTLNHTFIRSLGLL